MGKPEDQTVTLLCSFTGVETHQALRFQRSREKNPGPEVARVTGRGQVLQLLGEGR